MSKPDKKVVSIDKKKGMKPISRDGLQNLATGLGTARSKRSSNQWVFGLLNAFQQLDAAYQVSWIARQIVDIPAEDMTREWRTIKSSGAEEIASVEQRLNIPNMVQEAITWARLYGGSGIVMLTNQDLGKPLNVDAIGKGDLKRVLVFDRWDLSALTINTWDVLAANYLKPEFYNLRGGNQQIHWTHVVRFNGEKLPKRQEQQTQGWGDSVLRKCLDDVTDMVAAKDGIAELMQEANIDTLTVEGLLEALASDEDDSLTKRYELFSLMKSNVQMGLLDKGETLERKTLNLSGVAPIIESFMTWISGCAKIPVTKMFGTSAKGLNATGDGDMKNYYDMIRANQKKDLDPPLIVLDEVMVRSALGEFPDDFDYEWNPLELPNVVETEQANLLKAQKDEIYLNNGIVTPSQIQRDLQTSEQYQFNEEDLQEREELEELDLFQFHPEGEVPKSRASAGFKNKPLGKKRIRTTRRSPLNL